MIDRLAADLSNTVSVAPAITARIKSASAVANATTWTAVDSAEAEDKVAHAVNAGAPGEMGRIYAKEGLPFLHDSTDYVFDSSGKTARDEADPTAPLSADYDGAVAWDDPELGIDWGIAADEATLSSREAAASRFADWTSPLNA